MAANDVMDEDFDYESEILEAKLDAIARLVSEFRREWDRRLAGGQQVQPRWMVPMGAIKELERILQSA